MILSLDYRYLVKKKKAFEDQSMEIGFLVEV